MMQKGFTLIEMLVAVGLFAVVMTTTTMLLFASLRSTKKASSVTRVKSEGSYIIQLLTTKLRYASIETCANDEITAPPEQNLDFKYQNKTLLFNGSSLSTLEISSFNVNCALPSMTINFEITDPDTKVKVPFQTQVVLRNTQ